VNPRSAASAELAGGLLWLMQASIPNQTGSGKYRNVVTARGASNGGLADHIRVSVPGKHVERPNV